MIYAGSKRLKEIKDRKIERLAYKEMEQDKIGGEVTPNYLYELDLLRNRWSTLKERIEQEILDLCDTAADKTVREICAEQEGMMRIQEIIKELEEK